MARYAGLTGSPDESGSKRREKGLAKAGNARVRRGLIQLAWRFLVFQKGAGALVSHADRGAERRTQDHNDRGTSAQATDRAVAPGHDRRDSGRCRVAAGFVSNTLENGQRVRHLTALNAPGSR